MNNRWPALALPVGFASNGTPRKWIHAHLGERRTLFVLRCLRSRTVRYVRHEIASSSQFIQSVNNASPTRTSTSVEARRMQWPWRITRTIRKKPYRYAAHDNCEIRKEIFFNRHIYLDRKNLIVMINVEFLSFSLCFTVSIYALRNALVN